jgi:Glycosyl hydrolases family 16
MSVTLTDEQAKNWAATLRSMADTLDPPVTAPPSTPPTTPPATTYAGFSNLPIFEENFTTNCAEGEFVSKYGSKWALYNDGWQDTSKKGRYNTKNVSVSNGIANVRMFTSQTADPSGIFRPQVCALQPKINNSSDLYQLYGRYEYRLRADSVDGYKVAWLLWPKSGVWPRDGEIDFPEADLLGTVSAFMHRQNGTSGSDQDHFGSTTTLKDFHTYAMEWKPSSCEFFIDGKSIGKSTSRVPNTPMRFVCQNETELNSTYPAKTAVANVQIDYFKAWRYTG